MILVHCHTNIDQYRCERWPREMCCRPQIGDSVESESGKVLKVCQITHRMGELNGQTYPMLFVELHR